MSADNVLKHIVLSNLIAISILAGSAYFQNFQPDYSPPLPTVSPTPQPSPTFTPAPSLPSASPSPTPVPPTPQPSVVPSPIPEPLPKTYTVVPGDTLGAIAQRFGLRMDFLLAINPQIINPNVIYVGQVLLLQGMPVPRPTIQPTVLPVSPRAAVVYRIQTTRPVVFLTIDDGAYTEPGVATSMQSHGLVASFFLAYTYIQDNPGYFASLRDLTGSKIEAHTYSHQNLVTLSYAGQRSEIERGLDLLGQLYGRRPVLFRPPYGNFNDDTRLAAGSLGIKTLILWDVTVNDGVLAYASGNSLRPGDIVLMHFRPTFIKDIDAFAQAMEAQGFHTELLENWGL